jgi:hypothetical protein
MLLERTNPTVALHLQEVSGLDLSTSELQFRALIPDVPAKDTMVSETVLEYRRFNALRRLGSGDTPTDGSLLALFLTVAPSDAVADGGEPPTYREVFGHDSTYVWRTPVQDLLDGDPMPGGGAGSDSSEM